MSLSTENYLILSLYFMIFLIVLIVLIKKIIKILKYLKQKLLLKIKPYSTLRDLEMDMLFFDSKFIVNT